MAVSGDHFMKNPSHLKESILIDRRILIGRKPEETHGAEGSQDGSHRDKSSRRCHFLFLGSV